MVGIGAFGWKAVVGLDGVQMVPAANPAKLAGLADFAPNALPPSSPSTTPQTTPTAGD